MTAAKIIGVYSVSEAEEPCHLIELAIFDGSGVFPVADITQEIAERAQDNWQVPYSERLVSGDGKRILTEEFEAEDHPDLWHGDFRLVFFFHYLDVKQPLITPFGTLQLPAPSGRPSRLRAIEYEAP